MFDMLAIHRVDGGNVDHGRMPGQQGVRYGPEVVANASAWPSARAQGTAVTVAASELEELLRLS
jgi:hypothetical protein